jgi:hypothetical protein
MIKSPLFISDFYGIKGQAEEVVPFKDPSCHIVKAADQVRGGRHRRSVFFKQNGPCFFASGIRLLHDHVFHKLSLWIKDSEKRGQKLSFGRVRGQEQVVVEDEILKAPVDGGRLCLGMIGRDDPGVVLPGMACPRVEILVAS